ncbi:hypothetical protein [Micromonospora aurantiaca (nom. illeg.)]|uniref:hypothetical protein n=1 Tax=Micromonospora aurantiaca (nom. illeg.) TaxID=47850 RepID=UPI001FD33B92|nr:hypothetical protein [Micromonospora aurantiaca]
MRFVVRPGGRQCPLGRLDHARVTPGQHAGQQDDSAEPVLDPGQRERIPRGHGGRGPVDHDPGIERRDPAGDDEQLGRGLRIGGIRPLAQVPDQVDGLVDLTVPEEVLDGAGGLLAAEVPGPDGGGDADQVGDRGLRVESPLGARQRGADPRPQTLADATAVRPAQVP